MAQEDSQGESALQEEVARLRGQHDRYRAAMQDTMEQVDWCIGYFTAQNLHGLASRLSANLSHIRTDLLGRHEQPLPKPPAPTQPS